MKEEYFDLEKKRKELEAEVGKTAAGRRLIMQGDVMKRGKKGFAPVSTQSVPISGTGVITTGYLKDVKGEDIAAQVVNLKDELEKAEAMNDVAEIERLENEIDVREKRLVEAAGEVFKERRAAKKELEEVREAQDKLLGIDNVLTPVGFFRAQDIAQRMGRKLPGEEFETKEQQEAAIAARQNEFLEKYRQRQEVMRRIGKQFEAEKASSRAGAIAGLFTEEEKPIRTPTVETVEGFRGTVDVNRELLRRIMEDSEYQRLSTELARSAKPYLPEFSASSLGMRVSREAIQKTARSRGVQSATERAIEALQRRQRFVEQAKIKRIEPATVARQTPKEKRAIAEAMRDVREDAGDRREDSNEE
jgi:hypothetical protein